MEAIASSSLTRMPQFCTQGLANTAWAMSRLECDNIPLLASIAEAAIRKIGDPGDLDSQNLANLAWAYAKLYVVITPLLTALSAASRRTITQFKPLELPITFWAFATLALEDSPLRDAISSASIRLCSDLQMLDLSNTAWALALSGKRDVPLLEAIAAQAIRLLSVAAPQSNLGNPLSLLWANWRLTQQRLEHLLFKQFADLGILVELVSCGVVMMSNEWRRLDPVEVHLEEAMQAVCFWS